MMTSRSLICLLENQNGGKLQKILLELSSNKSEWLYHYENNELTDMLLMYGQCYHAIRMQLRRPESTQGDFQKDTILGHVSY
jgi:hypothetical protein